ncbi:MAG: hypothetical protein LBV45_06890 [Xanthomonadaceae bacterium]|nr:hypothetical protein [Xanthomonadaceae bacterium]
MEEHKKAKSGETTNNCREQCMNCGANAFMADKDGRGYCCPR